MKTKLHKLIGMAVLGVTLQTQSLPAWAGLVSNTQVTILHDSNDTFKLIGAYGTMTGARYSADTQQYIGCSGLVNDLYCSAQDKIGRFVSCYSSDPKLIAAVNAMTDSSYISFRRAPGTTQCSELTVNNSSPNLR
jgi:hypothetical protein